MDFPHLFLDPQRGSVPGHVPGQADASAAGATAAAGPSARFDARTRQWLEQLSRADTWCAPTDQARLVSCLARAFYQSDGFPMHRGFSVIHHDDLSEVVNSGSRYPRYLLVCHDDHRTQERVFSACVDTALPASMGPSQWVNAGPGAAGFFGSLARLLSEDGQWDALMSRHALPPAERPVMLRHLMVQELAHQFPHLCEQLASEIPLSASETAEGAMSAGPAWQPRSTRPFHPIMGLLDVHGMAQTLQAQSSDASPQPGPLGGRVQTARPTTSRPTVRLGVMSAAKIRRMADERSEGLTSPTASPATSPAASHTTSHTASPAASPTSAHTASPASSPAATSPRLRSLSRAGEGARSMVLNDADRSPAEPDSTESVSAADSAPSRSPAPSASGDEWVTRRLRELLQPSPPSPDNLPLPVRRP